MTKGVYSIKENILIAKNTYKMILCGDTSALSKPGQFINILIDGFYLRRPISVCDYDDNSITIIYKVVGKGTESLSKMGESDKIDILVGLGNGFSSEKSGDLPLVIGGGAGVPPMYNLTKKLINEGKKPTVILGFNTKDEVFFTSEFEKQGARVLICTADGSVGIKGFVTDAFGQVEKYTYFYTCGPLPMLKAVYDNTLTSGELSFEERMGCGFGACMGCSCKTKYKTKRICKDGPVLEKEEIIW